MAPSDIEARLIERLLSDPVFRARFQADPVAAAREAGFDGLAGELSRVGGSPLETLDFRESRSSLAGALLAAAVEGFGIYELGKHVLAPEDAHAATGARSSPALIPDDVPTAHASSSGWDPEQFGQQGTGGPMIADTLLLLRDKHVTFDAAGIADLKAGRIDPRVVSLLRTISGSHRITVSSMSSDHSELTAGGSVSNHAYGRAFDLSLVDGKPVTASNAAARRLAVDLSREDASIRPTEIGSPWSLRGAAYFTDGDHRDHIHVGFDDPIDPSWQSPTADSPASSANAGVAALSPDPDDWEGNLDDEDAGSDEVDGSDEDEADEGGGEDDDGGADQSEDEDSDDEDSGDEDSDDEDSEGEDGSDDEGSDDDQDTPGEGSNGEDANDDASDGDSSADSDEDEDSDDDEDDDNDSDSDDSAADSSDGDEPDLSAVDSAYPGEDAPRTEIAAWMGAAAQKRGLPPELPVMAALVESGLRNLDGGDADSVGFFQMRLSVWNQGEYAGYGDHPERQLDWFLDHAEAMKNQRIERGLSVTDSKQYGEWIADVERPAAQYRGRYQGQLDEARGLLASADGSHRVGNALADVAADVGGATAGPGALAALAAARNELGVPYLWGGSSPKTGFDCSGLVQWAYAKAGIQLPRIAADQFEAPSGTAVSRRDLLPGDLVFFKDSIGYVHHVGMYVGNDRFLAAPHTGDVVKISSLKEPYYAQEFAGGRRFARPGAAALEDAAARPEAVSRQAAAEAEAVRLAQAALERDAAEVNRFNSALFLALARQEQGKGAPGA